MLYRSGLCVVVATAIFGVTFLGRAEAAEKSCGMQSQWKQIDADYPRVMEQTRVLYCSLQLDIIENAKAAKDPNILTSASTLRQELRRYLVARNAEILVTSLADQGSYKTIRDSLLQDYELDVVQDIFNKAIDVLYSLKSVEDLSNDLEVIKMGRSDPATLQLYANARLHLFWKFINQGNADAKYMLKEAFYMQNLLKDSNLDQRTKLGIQVAIGFLPLPLLRLSSGKKFCLKNVHYDNIIYLTEKVDVDKDRGWVFVWRRSDLWGTESWEMRGITENNGRGMKYALWNPSFRQYMYMATDVENEQNAILAWRNGQIHPNSHWDIDLSDNKLVFSQKGYIMCTSTKQYDEDRNKVYGFKDSTYTATNPACQWVPQDC